MFDELPPQLKSQVEAAISEFPQTKPAFTALFSYYNENQRKKPKVEPTIQEMKPSVTPFSIKSPIQPNEIIFQLSNLSFMSPLRKKLNLILHLLVEPGKQPSPVLSVVNPQTMIPEVSITNFSESVRMCILLPILGGNINSKKKLGLLCIWMEDTYALNDKCEPLVCQMNFDIVKKEMIETGKIPEDLEEQQQESEGEVQPVHEAIIDFLERQFELCGLDLINYLPSTGFNPRNKVISDKEGGIAISTNGKSSDLVISAAYRGSKEGVLVFLGPNDTIKQPYMIYGFKKPILIFEMKDIKCVSYTSITRITFNILFTIRKFENGEETEQTLEFGMIDQQQFQTIDDFLKERKINDNSFAEDLREKSTKEKKIDEDDNDDDDREQQSAGNAHTYGANSENDEEQDGTFRGGAEESDSEEDADYEEGDGSESESGRDSESDSGSEEVEEAPEDEKD